MQGGPTSRLAARTDFAYRLLDRYAEMLRIHDSEIDGSSEATAAIDREVGELEQEVAELFGPRPEHRFTPTPIEPRVGNLDDDIARA